MLCEEGRRESLASRRGEGEEEEEAEAAKRAETYLMKCLRATGAKVTAMLKSKSRRKEVANDNGGKLLLRTRVDTRRDDPVDKRQELAGKKRRDEPSYDESPRVSKRKAGGEAWPFRPPAIPGPVCLTLQSTVPAQCRCTTVLDRQQPRAGRYLTRFCLENCTKVGQQDGSRREQCNGLSTSRYPARRQVCPRELWQREARTDACCLWQVEKRLSGEARSQGKDDDQAEPDGWKTR